MTPNPAARTRHKMREAALDMAEADVLDHGWKSLQMRSIAQRLGLSRQTLYNALSDKHGLAEALIARSTSRFLDGIEAAVEEATTEHGQWVAVVHSALAWAEADPLLVVVLSGEARGEFLPLLTSEGDPIIATARDRLVTVFLRHHPELDPYLLAETAESVTRLALSHIVSPTQPPQRVAHHIARLAATQ